MATDTRSSNISALNNYKHHGSNDYIGVFDVTEDYGTKLFLPRL